MRAVVLRVKRIYCGVRYLLCRVRDAFLRRHADEIVEAIYGGIWNLRRQLLEGRRTWLKEFVYESYFAMRGGWIGLGAKFEDIPTFPHSFHGVFISHSAHIGKRCVIFHEVTIGSNRILGSRGFGAPTIGDDVYIGCGAKIIGNVIVGNGARIGANCIVVKDVPPNSLVVLSEVRTIVRATPMENGFLANSFVEQQMSER